MPSSEPLPVRDGSAADLTGRSTNAIKQLKGLANDLSKGKEAKDAGKKISSKTGLPDCCICPPCLRSAALPL
jgi:hypothetical protein